MQIYILCACVSLQRIIVGWFVLVYSYSSCLYSIRWRINMYFVLSRYANIINEFVFIVTNRINDEHTHNIFLNSDAIQFIFYADTTTQCDELLILIRILHRDGNTITTTTSDRLVFDQSSKINRCRCLYRTPRALFLCQNHIDT